MTWKGFPVKTPKYRCWYEKGKVCYDKKGAITAANRRYKQDKIKLRAYWCDRCNFWHLTKQFVNIMEEVTISDLPADNQPIETDAEKIQEKATEL